ncbi:MAG TPA: alpha/beta fold hydrolase [Terriglobales bacterium]|nr:alpha/beta fold hydrolase [Terriglobales bacterium]
MRYLRSGSGQPLLLVHGLLGYSFSWRFNLEELGRIRTVIAPDLLGTGFSDRSSEIDCSARASADRMFQLMDQLGIESTDLLGTSHGGGVAVMMANVAPQRIRKLILVAPVNPWSPHGKLITKILATRFAQLTFPRVATAFQATSRFWLARLYGDPARISPGTLEGYTAPIALPGTWQYGLNVIACWHDDLRELEHAYAHISQPTLLLWGEKDAAVYASSAAEVKKRIPHAELQVLPGVGHLPYEETPQLFNQSVIDFLR